MFHILFPFVLFFIGAIAGRVRGSGLVPTCTESRYLVWGLPVAALVYYGTHNLLFAVASVVLAGLGATIGYWGTVNLSETANRNFRNITCLTATGLYRFFPLFVASCFVGEQWRVLPAVVTGVLFVPSYLLGERITKYLTLPLLTKDTEWGEFFFWGLIYAALGLGLVT